MADGHPATSSGETAHAVVIVGAGLAGLALAWRLERQGIRPTILDGAPRIAWSWRRRHDQLRLNTHRHFSRLPGLPLPREAGAFASREAVVAYLERYRELIAAEIQFGVQVSRIDRAGERWRLGTTGGPVFARHVVVATGRERVPVLPDWPGRDGFTGDLVHAADFGDVERYRDRSVLVVGAGNSGIDVLNHLVRIPTRELRLAVRGGVNIVPTWRFGFPVQRLSGVVSWLPSGLADHVLRATERTAFGNLERFGLGRSAVGAATRLARDGIAPAIDDGFVQALKQGRVTVLPAIAAFDGPEVVLVDGQRLRPDVVVSATGYSPGLEKLVGHLGVLDDRGIPRFHSGDARAGGLGLWFVGMRPRLFGNFHAARQESRALSRRIVRAEAGGARRTAPSGATDPTPRGRIAFLRWR